MKMLVKKIITLFILFVVVAISQKSFARFEYGTSNEKGELQITNSNFRMMLLDAAILKLVRIQGPVGSRMSPEKIGPLDELFLDVNPNNQEAKLISLEYMYIQRLIVQQLETVLPMSFNDGKTISIADLNNVYESIYDITSSHITVSVITKKFFLDGVEKDLINIPDYKMTVISLPAWTQASFEQKKLIVLHEMLGLAKYFHPNFYTEWLSDKDYKYSIPLKRAMDKNKKTEVKETLLSESDRPKFRIIPAVPIGKGELSLKGDSRCLSNVSYSLQKTALKIAFYSRCDDNPAFTKRIFDLKVEEEKILQDNVEVGWISGFQMFLRLPNETILLNFIPPYSNPYSNMMLDPRKSIDDTTRWSAEFKYSGMTEGLRRAGFSSVLRQIP